MTTTNNNQTPVSQLPLPKADMQFYNEIAVVSFDESYQGQEYVQKCAEWETKKLEAILPTEKQLNSMMDKLSSGNRRLLNEALSAYKSSKSIGKSIKA